MKYKFLIVIACLVILITSINVYAENAGVKIERIVSKGIQISDFNNIVLSDKDSIQFQYGIDDPSINTKARYRIVLKNAQDSSVKTTDISNAVYKYLPEGTYEFSVWGFDLVGTWVSSKTAKVSFRVNNSEAELRQNLESLQKKTNEQDSIYNSRLESNKQYFGLDLVSGAGGLLIGIILGSLLLIVIKSKSNKGTNSFGAKMEKGESITLPKSEYEKLLNENSSLRAEVASLRGQIDALQTRSSEMRKRNRDLEDSLNNLSSSKEELESLQKQKDELFALIIHDIKNPAALIKSLVELLRSYDLSAVEQQEIIDDIAETTSKIVALSHEVTKILALESSRMQLELESTQVEEIIKDVVKRNSIAASRKEISMQTDIAPNLPEARIDAQKIDEVLDNLVSNAIKFTQKSGSVRVKVYKDGEGIQVEVSDNGLGLSESDVRNAFQRGARLSAQPTAGETSTGLGLWIVKKLVDAHGGRVWVKSALGKGSTFAFYLPTNPEK